MANAVFTLEKGITVGEITHKDVELCELTIGEILKAEQYAEELRVIDGNPVVITSPSKLGLEMLRLQIKKLGDLDMPLSSEEFSMLSRTDLMLLQSEARKLETAAYVKVSSRGRDNQGAAGAL